MSKYLRLGFHLSWMTILLIFVGFIVEVASENIRFRIYTGEVSRTSNNASRYAQQKEILDREVLLARYLSQPFAPPTFKSMERQKIIDRGLPTARLHINTVIERAPVYFPELSVEDMKTTKNRIQALIDKLEKDELKYDIKSTTIISRQITVLQKEVLDYELQAASYNERVMAELGILSYQASQFSMRIVLFAFFINLIIFGRLQWLEYKTERRIQGLLE